MSTVQGSQTKSTSAPGHFFRMPEFDTIVGERSVGDMLRDRLEDAESQLRLERRRARRAERRAKDLARAVNNWHDLISDYERAMKSTIEQRRN